MDAHLGAEVGDVRCAARSPVVRAGGPAAPRGGRVGLRVDGTISSVERLGVGAAFRRRRLRSGVKGAPDQILVAQRSVRWWTGALVLAALLAGCNVVQWQKASLVASLREQGLSSRELAVGDDTVRAWVREGEGVPIVFVHGFGSEALWQWAEQVRAFDGRPLVLLDLLWFGRSRAGEPDYSLDRQAAAMAGALDALGMDRFDLVGISYGGLVVTELATAHPERVRRLVILDSPGRAYTREDHARLLARFRVRHVGELMVPARDEDVRRMMAVAYYDPPFAPDFVLSQIRGELYPPERRRTLYAILDSLERDLPRLTHRAHPTAPTLVIWGDGDPIFPLAIARRLVRQMPDARLVVIERARHTPNLERPGAVNAALQRFLR
ncbi:MAG: alpha/beta fold hydrolase [Sandaracinaceae bacterium]